jgi:hypothetical protein
VDGACIGTKPADDLFELSLHAGDNIKSSPQGSISLFNSQRELADNS